MQLTLRLLDPLAVTESAEQFEPGERMTEQDIGNTSTLGSSALWEPALFQLDQQRQGFAGAVIAQEDGAQRVSQVSLEGPIELDCVARFNG